MSGSDLFFITSDGVCACGCSRLADSSEYYPALSRNGKAVERNDEDIFILGEPTGVHYSAVTVINGNSREVVSKEALYGDIQSLFYGADWIAAVAAGETETLRENPVLYTFDRELYFTGKINTARIVNAPETNASEDYIPKDGGYLNVTSLTKQDGIYRMLGTYSVQNGKNTSSYFMAIAADTETGAAGSRLLSAEDYPYGLFTKIIWEENRAIACIGTMKNGLSAEIQQENKIPFYSV